MSLPLRLRRVTPFVACALLVLGAGRASAVYPVFDPDTPPTSATPPTEPWGEYLGAKLYRHQKGPKTMLYVYVKPTDGTTTQTETFASIQTSLNNASRRYYEASYHQTWFGPKVVNPNTPQEFIVPALVIPPVINLPGNKDYYYEQFWRLYTDTVAGVRALGGDWNGGPLDPSRFDRICVAATPKLIGSQGLAYVGIGFAWLGDLPGGNTGLHELGHNWGVSHANEWRGDDDIPRNPVGDQSEYGDGSDLMGGSVTLFNAFFRRSLGFLEDSRGEVPWVTTNGTYRLFAHTNPAPREPATNVRALHLYTIGSTRMQEIVLSFRHEPGPDGARERVSWERNAVQLHTRLNTHSGSHFVDTTPGSMETDDRIDGAIKIGRTYSEAKSLNNLTVLDSFHITPVARGALSTGGRSHEYIDVEIRFGDFPGNQMPSAQFAESIAEASVAADAALSVIASDPDGDALAYDWDFGDGTYSIVNTATPQKSYAAPGLYKARCTVTDMKGGTATAFQWVNVGNRTFHAPDPSPVVAGGLDYDYFERGWTALPDFSKALPKASGVIGNFSITPRQRPDNFGFVFQGFIEVPADDVYTFSVRSDDGVRLTVAGETVLVADGLKTSPQTVAGNIPLQAGRHPILLEYFHRDGGEVLEVEWSTLSSPSGPVPAAALSRLDWGANAAPAVSIASPAPGSEVLVGSDLLVQATASDADGIARVRLFGDDQLLGETTAAPYEATWPKVSVGSKTLTAIAYDNAGRRAISAPVVVEVISPPPTRVIGVNLGATNGDATVYANQKAGAVYAEPYWNNIAAGSGSNQPLTDNSGSPAPTLLDHNLGNAQTFTNSANPETPNGRLMRGGIWRDGTLSPASNPHPYAEFKAVPYAQYDVYVYFDYQLAQANDAVIQRYVLTPSSGAGPAPRFGRNSLSTSDSLGDYPTYDVWSGFRESTGLSLNASNTELFGNYVVFPNQTAETFRVEATRNTGAMSGTSGNHRRYFNAVQIVEVPTTIPSVRVTRPVQGWQLAEGGTAVTYSIALTLAPTGDVTVGIDSGTQLAADRASVAFTPANWSIPQVVMLRAVEDELAEGAHTGNLAHTVSATGNYAGATVATVSVAITDNDTPTVTLAGSGQTTEGSSTPVVWTFARASTRSIAGPLAASFSVNGTAAAGSYTLSGNGVVFDPATRTGNVTFAAGEPTVTVLVHATANAVPGDSRNLTGALLPGPGYTVGSPGSSFALLSDTVADYFTEIFAQSTYGNRPLDLNDRTVTFVPDGAGYRAFTQNATAYPSGTANFTTLSKSAMTGGTSVSGWWTLPLAAPFPYFGVSQNQIHVNTKGSITFAAGSLLSRSAADHFTVGAPRIALLWTELNPDTGGNVRHKRITTPGEERTVIYFDAVRWSSSSTALSAQLELFDTGVIRMTWRSLGSFNFTTLVGLSSGVAETMPSSPFTAAATPRPFVVSDLTGYPAPEANSPPAFAMLPPTTGTVGAPYAHEVVIADIDPADTIAITGATLPAWLSLTPTSPRRALLSGMPPSPGTYPVVVTASDGEVTIEQSFAIIVSPVSGNAPPAFTSPAPSAATIGSPFAHALAAHDPDGQALAFSVLSGPGWLVLADHGNGTATLSGTPPANTLATVPVVLVVSDGLASALQSFTLEVHRPPTLSVLRPLGLHLVLPNPNLDLHLEATADGHGFVPTPAWSLQSGPGNASFTDPASLSPRVRFDAPGLYVLRLAASTAVGTSATDLRVLVGITDSAFRGNGLQGYYRFNGDTVDSSGNDRHGTLVGGSVNSPGYEGSAFYGTSDNDHYVSTPLTHTGCITISTWFQADASPATWDRVLFSFRSSENHGRARVLLREDLKRLRFISSFSSGGEWQIEADIQGREWTHLYLAYDRSSTANDPVCYLDGNPVPVTRVNAPSGNQESSATLRIGCSTGSGSWRGKIDEFRVYNRLVPASEIPLLMVPAPINQAPDIAASAFHPTAPGQSVALDGAVTDDGLPDPPAFADTGWSIESGPAGGEFGSLSNPATTFTAGPTPGTYLLRLTADDGAARTSLVVELGSTAPGGGGAGSGFAAWIASAEYGVPPELRGPLDDPDRDGIPSLVEYALGGSPSDAGDAPLPSPGTVEVDGETYLTLSLPKNPTAQGITYRVESCSALSGWNSGPGHTAVVSESDTVLVARDAVGMGTAPARYLRLRIVVE